MLLPSPDPLAEPFGNIPINYFKVSDLSRGAFGFVQLCQSRVDGEQYAIKFIERGDKISEYVEWEILNHRSLYHPHVIGFKEVLLTRRHLAIVMEYAPGGDLCSLVAEGIMCRDIKLENTLLDRSRCPQIKICDFGMSKNLELQSLPGTRLGTMAYMAPEIIGADKGMKYDGKIADVWSSGVMLYTMLIGDFPFGRETNKRQMQAIMKAEFSYPPDVELTDEVKDLLSKILVSDPIRRITIDEIFNHPWFVVHLPPGAREMNETWRTKTQEGLQSVEEIKALVAEARRSVEEIKTLASEARRVLAVSQHPTRHGHERAPALVCSNQADSKTIGTPMGPERRTHPNPPRTHAAACTKKPSEAGKDRTNLLIRSRLPVAQQRQFSSGKIGPSRGVLE
eukprot:gene17868-24259_t